MRTLTGLYLYRNHRSLIIELTYSLWMLIFFLGFGNMIFAQDRSDNIRQARSIEIGRFNIKNPKGIAFSANGNNFLIIEDRTQGRLPEEVSEVVIIDHLGDPLSTVSINTEGVNPINLVFDNNANRLFMFQSTDNKLIEIRVKLDGTPRSNSNKLISTDLVFLQDPQGMSFDQVTGDLVILDSAGPSIVRISTNSVKEVRKSQISVLDLVDTGMLGLRGIAVDPQTGHFQVMNPEEKRLLEINQDGVIVANRDLSELELIEPQGMTYAPSGDLTDDPSQLSLYIADSGRNSQASTTRFSTALAQEENNGGQILEVSFTNAIQQESSSQGTLVQTVDTSLFSPPSPDPAGVTYRGSSDTLIISDSEVSELPIFTGVNQFETTRSGTLSDSFSTLSFTDEPTGVTINPINEHLFYSDDSKQKIFELDPGVDGLYGTLDDVVTSVSTLLFSPQSFDPEGLTYALIGGESLLFVADGTNGEIYRYSAGVDGVFFNGLMPGGDDTVTNFDVFSLGITDPEGIAYDSDNGHLFIVGQPPFLLAHTTTSGTLLRSIDISAADADKPAGLAYAPGSLNPLINNIYIVDRGVDNDFDPIENDGKMYEITIPPITSGNMPPSVVAGADQTIAIPAIATLDATITDDGVPVSGSLTVLWSHVSGPGSVIFSDAGLEDTTATFSIAGTYVLRLEADDSELIARDDITVTVAGSGGELVKEFQISASSDDAEERDTGRVDLISSDLEIVFDGGGNQTVGLRFDEVDILQQSTILNAFIQFRVDEGNTEPTSLTIQGEAVDNASTFITSRGNISNRPLTSAAVPWSPPPWPQPGVSGPEQRTSNIAAIIQEIIDRPGWVSSNALSIIISGTGERTAETIEGDHPEGAPTLHIEYLERVENIPEVTIINPINEAIFNVGDTVIFTGSANDLEDGDLSADLSWTSDKDGIIGSGATFTAGALSLGTHVITTSVVDSSGFTGSAILSITINEPPTVSISAPSDSSVFNVSDSITFAGSANDSEDGDLSAILDWSSDLDGDIGSGASFMTSTLSIGIHTITASVTDSSGLTRTDTISISVTTAGGNLVGNPSFESNISGWSAYSGATLQRVSGGFDGTFSLAATGPDSLATFGINDTPSWVPITPEAGTRYRITAWVKSDVSTGFAHLSVREYLGGSKVGATTKSSFIALSPSWQMIAVDRITQASGSSLDIQVLNDPVTTGETFQIDSVSIQIISAAVSIGDFVWNDLNGDGLQDGGAEVGFDNVTVELISDVNSNGIIDGTDAVLANTITAGGGFYAFTGLAAGSYIVNITDTNNVLSGSSITGGTTPLAVSGLTVGLNFVDADFGYQLASTASIGDFVWNDLNGNGLQDGGAEVGFDNVTVALISDVNSNGIIDGTDAVLANTITAGGGFYAFTGLSAGNYIVNITDTNNVLSGSIITGGTTPLSVSGLTAGLNFIEADFGYQLASTASIGDFVWNDLNGDGVQDGGAEVGFDNVTVALISDVNGNGIIDGTDSVLANTITAGGGFYAFTGLSAGNYIVNITDTNNVLSGFSITGGTTPLSVSGLTAGLNFIEADFGYQLASTASIGDFVWNDLNGDGVQDGGAEVGFDNVTVALISDVNGNGIIDGTDSVLANTITAGGGFYAFTGLAAGSYIVNITDTNNVLSGFSITGGTTPLSVSGLTAGLNFIEADFGYQLASTASIGDFVWNDLNGNGVQDGGAEVGFDNVTVALISDVNGNGIIDGTDAVLASTITADGGFYDFTGLSAGNYIVNITDTNNVLTGSTITGGTNPLSVSGLTGGQNFDDADYGYQQLGGVQIVEIPVSAGSDDAEERGSESAMSLDSSDLELVDDDESIQTVGIRFTEVSVPQQSTIVEAYIQFQTDEVNSGTNMLRIHGEAVDDAATFTTTAGNISARPLTSEPPVLWSLPDWTIIGEAGPDQRTPDIASIIQEIVNRTGWLSGNSLAIIFNGTGERTAESFEGGKAPLLHIKFTTADRQAPTVTITAPTNNSIFDQGASISFSGTAIDTEDGNLSDNLNWNSSIDGNFATGANPDFELSVGSHTVTVSAVNSGGLTGADQIDLTVIPNSGSQIIEVAVSKGSDDAEERVSDSSVQPYGTDLELADDGSREQIIGLRFRGITIPRQSMIVNAYIQFQADETDSGAISLTIQGEASDNPLTFNNTPGNISSRPLTSASVSWSPPDWTAVGERGSDQQTSDIKNIIQEIVNRPGWSSGNSLAVLIRGSGERTAESFNGAQAPSLYVEFGTSADQPPTVAIAVPSTDSVFDTSDFIAFSGSANDSEDGNITTGLVWNSNLVGQIGTGGSFSISLPPGTHTIQATVADSEFQVGLDQITIDVIDNGGNLVGNSSFEIDSVGWRPYAGSTIQRISGGFVGTFSLEVAGPDSLSTFGINDGPNWVSTTPALGTRYRFTAWVRSDASPGFAHLSVREYLGRSKVGSTTKSGFIPLSPSWQMITVDRVTEASGSTLDFQVLNDPVTAGEIFQIDGMSIQIIP